MLIVIEEFKMAADKKPLLGRENPVYFRELADAGISICVPSAAARTRG